MDLRKTKSALMRNGYTVSEFKTAEEAAAYLNQSIDHVTVGFGDSKTLEHLRVFESLSAHNTVFDPNQSTSNDEFVALAKKTLLTDVFLTSVNAMAETGELVNIDGSGNRVAGSLFGHRKVYFVVGTNKIEPTLSEAVHRARYVAAPKNSMKYNLRTPCAASGGEKCFDCNSPDRICNVLAIYFKKMDDTDEVEVVLIDEELGY